MIGGLDFLWDFNTFPIDDELINNFRTEHPAAGGARCPWTTLDATTNPIDAVPHQRVRLRRTGARRADPTRASPARAGGPGGNGVVSTLYQENRLHRARRTWTGRPTGTTGSASAASSPGTPSTTGRPSSPARLQDAYKEKPIRWNGSSKTASTWVTWWWWAACGTTTTTAARRRPERLPGDLDHARRSIRTIPDRRSCSRGTRATTT